MTSLSEYFKTVGKEELFVSEEYILPSNDVVIEEFPSSTDVEGKSKEDLINIVGPSVSYVDISQGGSNEGINNIDLVACNEEVILEDNNDCMTDEYQTETQVVKTTGVVNSSVESRIGPFADCRPICNCELIKDLTSKPECRFLLSLLPDMAEMSASQKTIFKNRVIQLLSEVDNFDLVENN